MLSGNQSKLSMRPPQAQKTMSQDEGLKNLQALDEWSEKPALEIANAIGQGAQASNAVAAVKIEELPAPKIEEKKASAKKQNAMPWEGVTGIKSCTFRLPAELAEKLKYLGGTTFGESINSIVIAALEKEVRRLLKERNEQSSRISSQAD